MAKDVFLFIVGVAVDLNDVHPVEKGRRDRLFLVALVLVQPTTDGRAAGGESLSSRSTSTWGSGSTRS